MKLNDYLGLRQMTTREFAGRIKASESAVKKWRAATRIPRAAMIAKISKATKGAVRANDWY